MAYLDESIDELFQLATVDTRVELLSRLQSYTNDPQMQALQPGLNELLAKVVALSREHSQ